MTLRDDGQFLRALPIIAFAPALPLSLASGASCAPSQLSSVRMPIQSWLPWTLFPLMEDFQRLNPPCARVSQGRLSCVN